MQVPLLIPQQFEKSFYLTILSWQTPTMIFPEAELSILKVSSSSPSAKALAPTTANLCPEWDVLVTVLRSGERCRQGCLAEMEKVSISALLLPVWGENKLLLAVLASLDLTGDIAEGLCLPGLSSSCSVCLMEACLVMSWLVVVLLMFLKIAFILLNSSLVASTYFLRERSNYWTRSIKFSRVVVYPEMNSYPNQPTTKSISLYSFASDANFSECASKSSGTIFLIDVVECP